MQYEMLNLNKNLLFWGKCGGFIDNLRFIESGFRHVPYFSLLVQRKVTKETHPDFALFPENALICLTEKL